MCFFLSKMTFSQKSLWKNMTFSRNLMGFQKRDFGQLANFGERSGKMSHRQN